MPQEKTSTRERKRVDTIQPRKYKVIMHNDDKTTMDFVVMVLTQVFFKSKKEAEFLMLTIHNEGQAVVGIYTYDIANSKIFKVKRMATEAGFPLKLTAEPA
ncbi:MAG: ATP-dependent Clp protease adaptor ClpS [Bacteroidales bacterium]|nr:ATP-dependent Clp protease adaptor ClpS [Bacteroidales bacterium]